MIQLRKRWPILTGLVALLTYGANHYRIAGLDDLRLEARAAPTPSSDASGFDMPAFGQPFPGNEMFGVGSPPANAFRNIPPWDNMLSVGEKLAIWQESQNSAPPTPYSESALRLPGAVPIPLPIPLTNDIANGAPQLSVPGLLTPGTANAIGLDSASSIPKGNLVQRSSAASTKFDLVPPENTGSDASRIRVASFNLGGLGPAKLSKPHVPELLVKILRQYDVIALQQIESTRDDILPLLVERLNQSGRSFDYMVGPRVGREQQREQFAFLFDTSRLETDRFQLYTVDDPEEIMTFDPLVAWFRCKGVPVERAFTFSLVNIHIDPNATAAEQALLPNLIEAIVQDGRREDDWILLGDFADSTSALTMLHNDSIRFGIRDIPTDIAGQRMLDTILFSARGTTEFTGRSGVFDFLRKYNLSLENALEVSDHMPIWAEFSTTEGANPGRVAPLNPESVY